MGCLYDVAWPASFVAPDCLFNIGAVVRLECQQHVFALCTSRGSSVFADANAYSQTCLWLQVFLVRLASLLVLWTSHSSACIMTVDVGAVVIFASEYLSSVRSTDWKRVGVLCKSASSSLRPFGCGLACWVLGSRVAFL